MLLRVLSGLRIVICLVLLCALLPYSPLSAGGSVAGVDILSSSAYESGTYLYIVGELRNNTAGNVRFVRVSAVYYNDVGTVIGTDYAYTEHNILTPGFISPFKIMRETPPGYASYVLAVEYSTTTRQAVPQLAILSAREWVDSIDTYWIIGEVQNTTASTLEYVQPIITLYNQAGTVINVDYAFASIDVLVPGQKSPFKTLFLSGPTDYVTLTISTDASSTTDVPPNLRTSGVSHYTGQYGWLHFAGQVQNLGATPSQFTEVILTLYDATGNIVNCDTDYTDPSTIPAGGSAAFEIILYDRFAGWTTYAIYPPESAPTPTQTPTRTSTQTPTRTNTPTSTASRTPTPTPTTTQTATPTTPATLTPTDAPTATPTSTKTEAPVATSTATLPASSSTPTATPPGDITLTGRVYDATLGPLSGIPGAIVAVAFCFPASLQTTALADGSYTVLLPALYLNQCSSVSLEARASGYQSLTFSIPVDALRAQPIRDLALIPLATETPTAVPSPTKSLSNAYMPLVLRR